VAVAVLGLVACGGGTARVEPSAVRAVPSVRTQRESALQEIGRRIFAATKGARPRDLVFDDLALRTLLESEAASRYSLARDLSAERLGMRDLAELDDTRYAGICIQDARLEPPNTFIGLREPGWVFARALVLAVRPGGRRIGWWVEGTFVYTDIGFGAVALQRIEPPRWEHSDLDIAPCDMEVGIR
jgi:hypothetical protein